jgi:hypothetical protein
LGEKILSMPSFGVEVKALVPCQICGMLKIPKWHRKSVILAKLPDTIVAHSSTFRC